MHYFKQHLSTNTFPFFIKEAGSFLLSESNYPKENLLNFQVKSWDPKRSFGHIRELENYRKKILSKGGKNYSLKRLNFTKQEAITVFIRKNNILGFCTAWNRESYPPYTARILNRFWFDPKIRRLGTKVVLRLPVFISIEHQCAILRKKDFKWAFISRPYGSNQWCYNAKRILNEQSSVQGWEVSNDLILVCQEPTNSACWQWLIFAKLGNHKDNFDLLNHHLSKGGFIEKFKKKK